MDDSRTIAEITLTHPELVLTPTTDRVSGIVAELEYQTIVEPGEYYLFFKITWDDLEDGLERFERFLEADPTVSDVSVTIDGGDFRVYRMRLTSAERLVLPEAAELGIRVLHAKSGEGGWIATLEIPEMDRLRQFREFCAEKAVGVTVERLYHAEGDEHESEYGLTPTQRETLVTAYESGYFNDPRDAGVESLADALGVSSSAVSGRLRRGMKALLENTVLR